jgi:hypothetical protein
MNNIENLLNSPAAESIFRRHKIAQRGMDGVRAGYNAKGTHFMTDLIKAVSPGSVLNGNYGNDDEMGPPTLDQFMDQSSGGKGWDFWEKTLTMIGKTGQTYSDIKANITGNKQTDDSNSAAQTKNSNTIIYVVAGVIIVVVAALLFWKK